MFFLVDLYYSLDKIVLELLHVCERFCFHRGRTFPPGPSEGSAMGFQRQDFRYSPQDFLHTKAT